MDDIEILLTDLKSLFKEEKYTDMQNMLYDELLEKQKNTYLYIWKSIVCICLEKIELSSDYLAKAIKLNHNPSDTYFWRGNIWFEYGYYFRAIADYLKARETDPDDIRLNTQLGIAYYNNEEYDRSFAVFNNVANLDINNKIAYNYRGLYWFEKEKYDKAIKEYDMAIEIDPDYADAYYNRGNCWFFKNLFENAISDFASAIELKFDPLWRSYWSSSKAYKELADVSRASNNLSDSAKNIELAIASINEAINNHLSTGKDSGFLESYKKDLFDLQKLVLESLSSQTALEEINNMKLEVERAKERINTQANEIQNALGDVEKFKQRISEQAKEFEILSKNVEDVEKKFNTVPIKLKSLESFFEETLKEFETKVKNAERQVFNKNIGLILISCICVSIIAIIIYNDINIIKDKAIMIYMISLTLLVLSPFIWMLKLAIKKRNELILLETEYRHKTALSSSLYSFNLALGEFYTKETTKQVFETIFGQNPTELLTDDKSVRMSNRKEQEYPHITIDIVQKILPDIVERCVKAIFDKKDKKHEE